MTINTASLCPRCGRSYFICGFCNSELYSIEAVLLEEDSCKFHYCSSDCINEDVHLLQTKYSREGGMKLLPLLVATTPARFA